ncbi:unnamed protein product [Adineta ricciae]|uniref:ATP-grasp domain-containing protein n=1 Tax=Adineta ricciae TaxID=249248 RepID=A0A815CFL6_ADIRI|nr:unnamed protein product [Adineta ricciae]CAF1283066.1 unnamed protein product [Adineta ricciae]
MTNIHYRMKTLGFLLLFLLASPITLFITLVTLFIHVITRKPAVTNPHAKRILISNAGMTKALQMARSLHSDGHYVVFTEEYPLATHRYSRCVSKFHLCADSDDRPAYIKSITDIVRRERIDLYVPVSHSSTERVDARIREVLLQFNCETFHGTVEQLDMLSDKCAFIDQARSFGLTVPKSYRITDRQQVLDFDFSKEKHEFILKSIAYDSISRLNLRKLPCHTRQETIDYVSSLPIGKDSPWILQEFIPGKEYCTHGAVRNGELRLYCCCESSPWLLQYKHINNKPLILEWVCEFCARINLTGQASFDFIESIEDGRPYAIECNPRTHTAITAFYNQPLVAQAYLDKEPLTSGPIQPLSTARETYWLYHELWSLFRIRCFQDWLCHFNRLFHGKEAIYSIDDPLPFLLHYTVHMPYLLLLNLLHPRQYNKVDCALGLIL